MSMQNHTPLTTHHTPQISCRPSLLFSSDSLPTYGRATKEGEAGTRGGRGGQPFRAPRRLQVRAATEEVRNARFGVHGKGQPDGDDLLEAGGESECVLRRLLVVHVLVPCVVPEEEGEGGG